MSEKEKPDPSESLPAGELSGQSSKETRACYTESPPPLPPGHEIHERQRIPTVPDEGETPDDTPSPPVHPD